MALVPFRSRTQSYKGMWAAAFKANTCYHILVRVWVDPMAWQKWDCMTTPIKTESGYNSWTRMRRRKRSWSLRPAVSWIVIDQIYCSRRHGVRANPTNDPAFKTRPFFARTWTKIRTTSKNRKSEDSTKSKHFFEELLNKTCLFICDKKNFRG